MKIEILDFYADWCNPCKNLAPVLDELAETYDNVNVTKINIEDNPEQSELYKIKALPTLIIIKNDEEFIRTTGFKTRKQLVELIGL